jgi:hypothetical protein
VGISSGNSYFGEKLRTVLVLSTYCKFARERERERERERKGKKRLKREPMKYCITLLEVFKSKLKSEFWKPKEGCLPRHHKFERKLS